MTPAESQLSVERLRQLVRLDAEAGELYWLPRLPSDFQADDPERACNSWNTRFAGKRALTRELARGYRHGCLLGISEFYAHRVVFALHHGVWPEHTVDHEDRDPRNNRPGNLRDVLHQVNGRNQRLRRNNTSGVLGVYFDSKRQKYEAHINVDGKKKTLGRFTSLADATAARARADQEHGYHPTHGTRTP